MLPRNVIEEAVRAALASERLRGSGIEAACWCPLCLADMQALALSSLPPRYVTRREDRSAIGSAQSAAVGEQVAQAVRQVSTHRKHRPEERAADAEVAMVNFAYEVGFALIEERLMRQDGACECFDCRCDAVAFALNRFPPQYGVALRGRSAFTVRSRSEMGAEMSSFLDLGVRVVTDVPRH